VRARGTFSVVAKSVALNHPEGDVGFALVNRSDSVLELLSFDVWSAANVSVRQAGDTPRWSLERQASADVVSPARPGPRLSVDGFAITPMGSEAPPLSGVRVEQRPILAQGASAASTFRVFSFQYPDAVQSAARITSPISEHAASESWVMRNRASGDPGPIVLRAGEALLCRPIDAGRCACVSVELTLSRGGYSYRALAMAVQPEVACFSDQGSLGPADAANIFAVCVDSGDPVSIVAAKIYPVSRLAFGPTGAPPKARAMICDDVIDRLPRDDVPNSTAVRNLHKGSLQDVSALIAAHDKAYALPPGIYVLTGAGRVFFQDNHGATTAMDQSQGATFGGIISQSNTLPLAYVPSWYSPPYFGAMPPIAAMARQRWWPRPGGRMRLQPGKAFAICGGSVSVFPFTTSTASVPGIVNGSQDAPCYIVDVALTFAVAEQVAYPPPRKVLNNDDIVRAA
jgi:hypothetical protein